MNLENNFYFYCNWKIDIFSKWARIFLHEPVYLILYLLGKIVFMERSTKGLIHHMQFKWLCSVSCFVFWPRRQNSLQHYLRVWAISWKYPYYSFSAVGDFFQISSLIFQILTQWKPKLLSCRNRSVDFAVYINLHVNFSKLIFF